MCTSIAKLFEGSSFCGQLIAKDLAMIERCVFILLSLALVASLGGFFLYVPILPNLAVTFMLGGLGAMFWLGIRVGRRPQGASISHSTRNETSQLSLS
jgi:hypothetical protein